jgi:hypothetical protein
MGKGEIMPSTFTPHANKKNKINLLKIKKCTLFIVFCSKTMDLTKDVTP